MPRPPLTWACGTCLFWALASLSAQGSTYYVSPAGSDSNNGSSTTSAFQTIQYAVSHVPSGSNVTVMDGTYDEAVNVYTSGLVIQSQNVPKRKNWKRRLRVLH